MRKSKRMVKQKKKLFILIALIVVMVAGVGVYFLGSDTLEIDVKRPFEKEEAKKGIEEEVKHVKIIDENSKSRPFAVMINNASDARSLQSGLQDAYIIYEIIVEGGITRYMALFKDQSTERIGSIRSSRHYYLDYALENDAIYVHHGQSPQAQSDFSTLKGLDRVVVNETTTGWRDKEIRAKGYASEHTLFTSIEKLQNGIGNLRSETNKDLLLKYSVDELNMAEMSNAQKADKVNIKYSGGTTTNYVYNTEKGYYMRSVNNKSHTDYVSGEQYHFKNIITYQVANNTIDGGGKGRQELSNIGSGKGYYISGGYAVPIKWEKKSRSSQTKYYYESGEELVVNDGNTFIQIQPKGQKLDIS